VSQAAPAPAVAARRIERRFGRSVALAGLDLEVEAGGTVALLGANGAGKTTLLRILAQVLRPTRGEVRIFGLDPGRDQARVLASLGFLSHEIALYLDLTPFENLVFTARLHGLDRAYERAREALVGVGIGGRDEPVRALSRGLQQRAARARALLHEPRLLLLDEPWTGLDPAAQRLLRERLAGHRDRGGTTIFTTHDLGEGIRTADRVVLLARGRIALDAATAGLTLEALAEASARAAAEGRA
jgi:heme exporter protein A